MNSSQSHAATGGYHGSPPFPPSQSEGQEHTHVLPSRNIPPTVTPAQMNQQFHNLQNNDGPSMPNNHDDENHTGLSPVLERIDLSEFLARPFRPFFMEEESALEAAAPAQMNQQFYNPQNNDGSSMSRNYHNENHAGLSPTVAVSLGAAVEAAEAYAGLSSQERNRRRKRELDVMSEADREAEIAKTRAKNRERVKSRRAKKMRKLAELPEAEREAFLAAEREQRRERHRRARG